MKDNTKINNITIIEDIRSPINFSSISFTGFKKSDVIKSLLNVILKNKVEDALYWTTELLCAGHYIDIFDVIFKVTTIHIHIGNPKLPIYIETIIKQFKNCVSQGYVEQEIHMRNSESIRKLFMESIVILCLSEKKHPIYIEQIKQVELQLSEIHDRLYADTVSYIQPYFKSGDAKDIFIPLNEFIYHIQHFNSSTHNASYWIEWMLLFDAECKRKKKQLVFEYRDFPCVQDVFKRDIVWIIWECILKEAETKTPLQQRIIKSIFTMYCLKFSLKYKKKRKSHIHYAIVILCESFSYNKKLYNDRFIVDSYVTKTDSFFKHIKTKEHVSKTNYMFHGLEQQEILSNKEKIKQMDNILQSTTKL